jgi:hypothetical protein
MKMCALKFSSNIAYLANNFDTYVQPGSIIGMKKLNHPRDSMQHQKYGKRMNLPMPTINPEM